MIDRLNFREKRVRANPIPDAGSRSNRMIKISHDRWVLRINVIDFEVAMDYSTFEALISSTKIERAK
jgi:hypothetical protein